MPKCRHCCTGADNNLIPDFVLLVNFCPCARILENYSRRMKREQTERNKDQLLLCKLITLHVRSASGGVDAENLACR